MSQGVHFIIGASGQLGTELALSLVSKGEHVVLSDVRRPAHQNLQSLEYVTLDVRDRGAIDAALIAAEASHVYLLAAALSARGEGDPEWAWDLNMRGLLNIMEHASDSQTVKQVFWPSSIAVFGPETPAAAPQCGERKPTTVYGISKNAGEQWCAWYREHRGVDVRSVRFPGLIGHRAVPGGGTTDYAVDIFIEANLTGRYTCYLNEDERLPMLYMDDAVDCIHDLMAAPADRLKVATSYNVHGMDFTPAELGAAIAERVEGFTMDYAPDFRQAIAANWPDSLLDAEARADWGWSPKIGMNELVSIMLEAKKVVLSET
ncbi:MAG: NAD-dependent epimerase/dehydratase family protein [Flavobacteriales bacterium]|nr:NAD-dependent epimerase/dehydratase family protein [Flavobacteriales bacterium]